VYPQIIAQDGGREMVLNDPAAYRRRDELDLLAELLRPHGLRVIELGCGAAWMTRQLSGRLGAAAVTALEVDRIQHQKNLALDLPGVTFRYGGAQSIPEPDGAFEAAVMLKSLHHVPVGLMDQALAEIHRVLVPWGRFYCSEPVYWGPFNDLMRLIEDEQVVREAAFAALQRAIERGLFDLEHEVFFESEGVYHDWETFEARFIDVTHSERNIDAARRAGIRAAFEAHLTAEGARFLKPHRIDLLRRRG
jgi:SAM-dependent methyltransferase